MTDAQPWYEQARKLRLEGASKPALARQFQRPLGQVDCVVAGICPIRRVRREGDVFRGGGHGSTWAPEADAYLNAHYNVDQSAAQIARHLNCTRNAVIGRAGRLGLARCK